MSWSVVSVGLRPTGSGRAARAATRCVVSGVESLMTSQVPAASPPRLRGPTIIHPRTRVVAGLSPDDVRGCGRQHGPTEDVCGGGRILNCVVDAVAEVI